MTRLSAFATATALVIFGIGSGTARADFATNLVAYYNFDNQVNAQVGGSALNGTLVGVTFAAGQSGFGQTGSFASSADQRGDLPDVAALNMGAGDFTVSMWLNMSEKQLSDTPVITNKNWDSGGNLGWVFTAARNSGDDPFANFTATSGGRRDAGGTVSMSLNAWHNVVYTVARSGLMTIYIDGAAQASVDITGTSGSVDTGFAITLGGNSGGPTGPRTYEANHNYRGLMDDLGIWKRALSASEVQTLHNDGVAGKTLGAELNPVPEPAALIQTAFGLLCVGSYAGWRRRTRTPPEPERRGGSRCRRAARRRRPTPRRSVRAKGRVVDGEQIRATTPIPEGDGSPVRANSRFLAQSKCDCR